MPYYLRIRIREEVHSVQLLFLLKYSQLQLVEYMDKKSGNMKYQPCLVTPRWALEMCPLLLLPSEGEEPCGHQEWLSLFIFPIFMKIGKAYGSLRENSLPQGSSPRLTGRLLWFIIHERGKGTLQTYQRLLVKQLSRVYTVYSSSS